MFNAITWTLPKIFADCQGQFDADISYLQCDNYVRLRTWLMCKCAMSQQLFLHQGLVGRF